MENSNTPTQFEDGNRRKVEKKIEEIISEVNPKIFENLDADQKNDLIGSIVSITHSFQEETTHSGPLPRAEEVLLYNSGIPDGGNRIMKMAESEHGFKQDLIKIQTNRSFTLKILGQILGFLLACSFLAGAVYCISNGHPWGAALGLGALTPLISLFTGGDKKQN